MHSNGFDDQWLSMQSPHIRRATVKVAVQDATTASKSMNLKVDRSIVLLSDRRWSPGCCSRARLNTDHVRDVLKLFDSCLIGVGRRDAAPVPDSTPIMFEKIN